MTDEEMDAIEKRFQTIDFTEDDAMALIAEMRLWRSIARKLDEMGVYASSRKVENWVKFRYYRKRGTPEWVDLIQFAFSDEWTPTSGAINAAADEVRLWNETVGSDD